MVTYLNTGRRLGLGSRRVHTILLGSISKTTPLRRGQNEVLLKKILPSPNTVDFNKSRCQIFQFLKPCLVKKKKVKRKMQGGKHTLYSLKSSENFTIYLGESQEREKKKYKVQCFKSYRANIQGQ